MADIKGTPRTTEWYLGIRPEDRMSVKHIQIIRQIMKLSNKPIHDLSQIPVSEFTEIISNLYIFATTTAIVADHFHNVAFDTGKALVNCNKEVIRYRKDQKNDELKISAKIIEQEREIMNARILMVRLRRDFDKLKQENEELVKQSKKYSTVFKQIYDQMICPICFEYCFLPKVLGNCGHIACENCLRGMDITVDREMTSSKSAVECLYARKCPLCRAEIIGQGFPVFNLKNIAINLVQNQMIEVSAEAVSNATVDGKIDFQRNLTVENHFHTLKIGCWVQSQLAIYAMTSIIAHVTKKQWEHGVYILFEAAVSRIFFETAAIYLHGKAGGVHVLVNSSQRMFAVQLIERRPAAPSSPFQLSDNKWDQSQEPIEVAANGLGTIDSPGPSQHVLIKVSTDGRYVITLTPSPTSQNTDTGPTNT